MEYLIAREPWVEQNGVFAPFPPSDRIALLAAKGASILLGETEANTEKIEKAAKLLGEYWEYGSGLPELVTAAIQSDAARGASGALTGSGIVALAPAADDPGKTGAGKTGAGKTGAGKVLGD